MTNRGNPRFKGPGQMWKTPWRTRLPYQEMAFFEGFDDNVIPAALYGASAPTMLGQTAAAGGFWVGAVVRLVNKNQATPYVVMRANREDFQVQGPAGYYLYMIDPGPLAGQERISAVFGVGNGNAYVEATATRNWNDANRVYRIMGVLQADNNLRVYIEGGGSAGVALGGAYNQGLGVGVAIGFSGEGVVGVMPPDNGIHGVVGGDGEPSAAQRNAWEAAIAEEYQIGEIAGLTDDGWRANYPILPNDAPSPLAPFVTGGVNQTEQNDLLVVNSYSPTIFGEEAA